MNKIKSYTQFLNESNSTNIVNVILDALEPTIVNMLSQSETAYIKQFGKEFSKYEREITRLTLIYDMVKSIEAYTMPSDNLLSINAGGSPKGNIEITAQIQREGVTYNFSTEVIYAGGYNIQRLHYRYITKTSIPKTSSKIITQEYSDKIKKMSKLEKINDEISMYEFRIKRAEELYDKNSKLSDDQIIQAIKNDPKNSWYEWPTWKEIVKRDAAKNYNNDESYYNDQREEGIAKRIESWKRINVHDKPRNIADYNKTIKKLQTKLDALL